MVLLNACVDFDRARTRKRRSCSRSCVSNKILFSRISSRCFNKRK